MKCTKRIILFSLIALFWCGSGSGVLLAQDSTEADAKKEKTAVGKGLKAIGKALSFKNFFHHSDSAKLARQYIREQQRLLKGSPDYITSDSTGLAISAYEPGTIFDLKYEVLGWYPYWEKEYYKNINYSLLTTIAYFSYEVNPKTGKAKTVHDWETTPLSRITRANGTKLLLTITNFGQANNRKFLNNDKAITTLIAELISLLKDRGDGVSIDFEGIPKSHKDDFSRFVLLLSQELRKANKDYLVYLSVPAVDWQKSLDLEVLEPVVDQFTIMGYNYYGSLSNVAGPVAPLQSGKQWEPYNLTTSVDYYLASKVPASKLILALPYYGFIWETKTANLGAKAEKYIGARPYNYIKKAIEQNVLVRYDTVSQSAWASYVRKDNNKIRQLWFDNDSTMAVKLNYIKQKGLNGMGIWALGYDKGYDDLWSTIAGSLTTQKTWSGDHSDTGINTGTGDDSTSDGNNSHGTQDGNDTNNSSDGSGNADGSGNGDGTGTGEGGGTGADDGPSWLSQIWDKLTNVDALLNDVDDYKAVLLFAMTFIVLYGGAGILIAMFKPETRVFFFGKTAYIIYYSSFVLLFLIVLLRWKNIFNNASVALILGFVAGAVCLFFVSKFIQRIHRDLP